VKEFAMYTGSRKGAVMRDTSDIDPSQLWADEIIRKENFCKEIMLAFVDENRLNILPYNYSYRYRQENKLIEIYNVEQNKWIPFAYGDKNKLVLKLGLTGIGNDMYFRKRRSLNHDETAYGAFNYAGLPSGYSLKDKESKIAWCNIHYTFY